MKRVEFIKKYWHYYKHLEERFMDISTFVYFDTANFNVYSYEFVSLLQIIGAEIDVLFKEACGYPGNKNRNMCHYKQDILSKYTTIKQEKDMRRMRVGLW